MKRRDDALKMMCIVTGIVRTRVLLPVRVITPPRRVSPWITILPHLPMPRSLGADWWCGVTGCCPYPRQPHCFPRPTRCTLPTPSSHPPVPTAALTAPHHHPHFPTPPPPHPQRLLPVRW